MSTAVLNGSLAADNDQALVDTGNDTAFSVVVTGTFVGTITLQALYDATESWVAATCFDRTLASAGNTLSAAGNRIVDARGAISLRAIMHPFTSGSASVTWAGTPAQTLVVNTSGGGGGAVTIANGADTAEGNTTDAAVQGDNPGTISAKLRGLNKSVAAGIPVTNANLDAALSTLVPTTDFDTKIGSLTETAPATDTASSGLNGRLQRIAQRLTSLIALLPSALTGSGNLKVALVESTATATVSGTVTSNQGTQNGAGTASWNVQGAGAEGAAVSGNPVRMGGSDGANIRSLATDASGRQIAVGAAADGAAIAGNPLAMGVYDGTNARYQRNAQSVDNSSTSTVQQALPGAALMLWDAGIPRFNMAAQAKVLVDADTAVRTLAVHPQIYNGASFDRQRNNVSFTILASASRTTTQGPTNFTTYNARALYLFLNTTVIGTGSITVKVDFVDSISGAVVNLITGGAVTTNTQNVYKIGIGLTAAANAVVVDYLPRTIAVTVTANNANAATYSLSGELIAA